MADRYPAPEQRVREFLDRFEPDHIMQADPGVSLTATDLRDVLAELDAARTDIMPTELTAPVPTASPDQKENQPMPETVTIARPAAYRPGTWLSPHELRFQPAPDYYPEHAGLIGVSVDNRYATVTPACLAEAITVLGIPGFTASYTPPRPPLPTEPGLYVLANRPSVDRGDVFCLTSGGSWDFDDDVWLSAEGAHGSGFGPLVPLTKGGIQ